MNTEHSVKCCSVKSSWQESLVLLVLVKLEKTVGTDPSHHPAMMMIVVMIMMVVSGHCTNV